MIHLDADEETPLPQMQGCFQDNQGRLLDGNSTGRETVQADGRRDQDSAEQKPLNERKGSLPLLASRHDEQGRSGRIEKG